MERQARALAGAEGLLDDARLIGEELERCRAVLDRMAVTGGEHVGEVMACVSVDSLFADVRTRLGPELAARWDTHSEVETLRGPREALVQMVENIARNGFDACDDRRVSLDVRPRNGAVELTFVDEGHGMDPEVQKRATDPFFTTKATGERMGLGLFLARTLVDSLGGRLEIHSQPRRGTTIVVVLPNAP